jgi:predicted nucleic acid-binding protein
VTYLLDVNVLIALGVSTDEFHERVSTWLTSLDWSADRLATCAITELAFVRIVPRLPGLGVGVAQAQELLRRFKRHKSVRFDLLSDALGAERLPAWVKSPKQTTDGHLLELAKCHSAVLATIDDKITGAFVVAGWEPTRLALGALGR